MHKAHILVLQMQISMFHTQELTTANDLSPRWVLVQGKIHVNMSDSHTTCCLSAAEHHIQWHDDRSTEAEETCIKIECSSSMTNRQVSNMHMCNLKSLASHQMSSYPTSQSTVTSNVIISHVTVYRHIKCHHIPRHSTKSHALQSCIHVPHAIPQSQLILWPICRSVLIHSSFRSLHDNWWHKPHGTSAGISM